MDSQLITSIGYEALLTARDSIAQRIEQAHALLREAQAIADQNNMGTVCGSSPHQFMPMAQFLKPDGAAKAVALTDSAAWELLLHKSHLMDLMSGRKKHEWRLAIAKGEAPPFNEAAVRGTLTSLHQDRVSMFELSVVECFESLHPCYMRNEQSCFGMRIHLTNVTDVYSGGLPGRSTCDQIDDLLRFMHVMDGRPTPHANAIRTAILECMNKGTAREYEDDFIRLTWFKNGNGHVRFKRKALVEAMNKMIAKHRGASLPVPRNARFKGTI